MGGTMVRSASKLLAVAAGAVLVLSVSGCSTSRAEVGECVAESGEDSVRKVDCADPDAVYKVVKVEEQGTFLPSFACRGVPRTVSVYSETGGSGDGFTLCLGNNS